MNKHLIASCKRVILKVKGNTSFDSISLVLLMQRHSAAVYLQPCHDLHGGPSIGS